MPHLESHGTFPFSYTVEDMRRAEQTGLPHGGGHLPHGEGPFLGKGPKNYERSDSKLLENVCERLALARSLDASDLEVTVKEGRVTLTGEVTSSEERWAAEEIAASVLGVRDVLNQIRARNKRMNA